MIRFVFWMLFLVASVGVGVLIYHDPGYLLLAYGRYTVEMPLWLGVLMMLLVWLIVGLMFGLLNGFFALGERVSLWWHTPRRALDETRSAAKSLDLT